MENVQDSGKDEVIEIAQNQSESAGAEVVITSAPVKMWREIFSSKSLFIQSGFVTINSALLALHLIANSKMLSLLEGGYGDAAAAAVSTFQTLTLGTATGICLATGIEIAGEIGKNRHAEAGQLAKASFVLTAGLGLASTVLMLGSKLYFPLFYEKEIAEIASDFFLGYGIGGIPILLVMNTPQIAFQMGDWGASVTTASVAYIPAAAFSYLLGFNAKLGAFGIGLGGSISALLAAAGIQLWLKREKFRDFEIYNLPIKDLKINLKRLLTTGSQIAFQRITEWGNMYAITLVLGAAAPAYVLSAIQPAVQYSSMIALSAQGLAHATTMLLIRNRAAMEKEIQESRLNQAQSYQSKSGSILFWNNSIGAIIAGVLSAFLIWQREAASNFFLSHDVDNATKELAQTILLISLLGMIFDVPRIVLLGGLRAWKDVFLPTLTCLLIMTIVGVPLGYGVSKAVNDDWSMIFIIRDVMILLSSGVMGARSFYKMYEDKKRVQVFPSEEERTPLIPQSSSLEENQATQRPFFRQYMSGEERAVENPMNNETFTTNPEVTPWRSENKIWVMQYFVNRINDDALPNRRHCFQC